MRARPVAISRFEQGHVGPTGRRGIGLQGLVERSDVAREDETERLRFSIDLEFDECTAENMAGIAQSRPCARQGFEPTIVR